MSLRARLLLVTTLTLAMGMGVLGLAGNALLARSIDADQHERLRARLVAVTASLSVDRAGRVRIHSSFDDTALDSDTWIARPDGRVLEGPPHAPPALTRLALALARSPSSRSVAGPHETWLGSQPLRFAGHRIVTVVAGVSVAQLQTLRREVLLGSLAVAVLTLGVGAVAIRRALNAALRPVRQMTRDAEEWGAHDLDRRFGLGPARDEITGLAATLDHLLARIAASRRHEQRFASEVAHELRTPLAAIRGVAELASDATELPEARDALGQIQGHSRRIATTLDTLIALARRESPPEAESVDLAALVSEFGVTVRLGGDVAPRVEGDPAVIRQALAPLVDNARRHAVREVTLELGADGDRATVTVRDDGPGVDPALAATIFDAGVQGPGQSGEGAGLGLALARRIAVSCGAELRLGDGPGGCFVLSLPGRELERGGRAVAPGMPTASPADP